MYVQGFFLGKVYTYTVFYIIINGTERKVNSGKLLHMTVKALSVYHENDDYTALVATDILSQPRALRNVPQRGHLVKEGKDGAGEKKKAGDVKMEEKTGEHKVEQATALDRELSSSLCLLFMYLTIICPLLMRG